VHAPGCSRERRGSVAESFAWGRMTEVPCRKLEHRCLPEGVRPFSRLLGRVRNAAISTGIGKRGCLLIVPADVLTPRPRPPITVRPGRRICPGGLRSFRDSRGGVATGATGPGSTTGSTGGPSRALLPCVGREHEVRTLHSALISAERGHGTAWLLTGPAGIGKSRILRRVTELARRRGFAVKEESCLEGSLTALLPFRRFLEARIEYSPGPVRQERIDWHASYLTEATHAPGARQSRPLAGKHSWRRFSPASSDVNGTPREVLSGPVDFAIVRLLESLEEESRDRPLLVVLDDVQYADSESVRCLRLLARRAPGLRMLVLGAARTNDGSVGPSREGVALEDFLKEGFVRPMGVGPLGETGSYELLSTFLGVPVDGLKKRPAVRTVLVLAGGVPYHLLELAASWPGILTPGSRREILPAARIRKGALGELSAHLPSAVRVSLERRLSALGSTDRYLLGLAARLGDEFDADALSAATACDPADVLRRLETLVERGWPLCAKDRGERRFAFEHALLRSVILGLPDNAPRAGDLRRLVRWWSIHRSTDAATEARLRHLARDGPGTMACLRRAVDQALDRVTYPSVVELLRFGAAELCETQASRRELAELYLDSTTRLRVLGESECRAQLLRDLSTLVAPGELPWRAEAWKLEDEASRRPEVVRDQLARLAARVARLSGRERSGALLMLRYLRERLGYWSTTAEVTHRRLARTISALQGSRLLYERCRLLHLDLMLLSNLGRWSEADTRLRELRRIQRTKGGESARLCDTVQAAAAHLALRQGRFDLALRRAGERVRQRHEEHDPVYEVRARLQLGLFAYAVRDSEQAQGVLREAERLGSELDQSSSLAACRVLQGWTWILDQDWHRAARAFNLGLEAARAVPWPTLAWSAGVGLSLATAELGNPVQALSDLESPSQEILRSRSYLNEYWWSRARILELCGKRRQARASLIRALHAAERPPAPVTDLLEGLGQLVRWAHRHSTVAEEHRWERRLARAREQLETWAGPPWKLIGGDTCVGGARSGGITVRVGPASGPSSGSLQDLILRVLGRGGQMPQATAGFGPEASLSEKGMAAALRVERNRFSRALGRLREAGLVERRLARPRGARRRVYVYRLSPKGSELLDARSLASHLSDEAGPA
jgi:DNA-binding MarR family transcriptional regulator